MQCCKYNPQMFFVCIWQKQNVYMRDTKGWVDNGMFLVELLIWRNCLQNMCICHLTVKPEEDEHHEEQEGPQWRQRHHGHSFRIRYER